MKCFHGFGFHFFQIHACPLSHLPSVITSRCFGWLFYVKGLYLFLFLFADVTCFQGFFSYPDMQPIMKHFCVYHLNAPGMNDGAMNLKPEYVAVLGYCKEYVNGIIKTHQILLSVPKVE